MQKQLKLLLTSSTNQTCRVALVDDYKLSNDPCTHNEDTQVDQSRSKSNMLKKQLRDANHKEM
jgi:hypothetical protein